MSTSTERCAACGLQRCTVDHAARRGSRVHCLRLVEHAPHDWHAPIYGGTVHCPGQRAR